MNDILTVLIIITLSIGLGVIIGRIAANNEAYHKGRYDMAQELDDNVSNYIGRAEKIVPEPRPGCVRPR